MLNLFSGLFFRAFRWGLIMAMVAVMFAVITQRVHAQESVPGETVKRIAFVTWNMDKHLLEFEYQEGVCTKALKDGKCEKQDVSITKRIPYEIDPDNATMSDLKEAPRYFSKQEAVKLHQVLDFLFSYAAESHDWFQRGEGKQRDPSVKVMLPKPPTHNKFFRMGKEHSRVAPVLQLD